MSYFGGKSRAGVFQRIINLIPPHEVYIEPFFGAGAIARLKLPARTTIGVDRAGPPDQVPAGVDFRCGCGIEFLQGYRFTGREFVYADPPYLLELRRSQRARYAHEMTRADHVRLLRVLVALPCPVLISGYPSPLYDSHLKGWRRDEFKVTTRGNSWANEVLWFNYQRPTALHDLRYVGGDYRERWRIEKRRRRWKERLEKMPPLERATLFAALVDVMAPGCGR